MIPLHLNSAIFLFPIPRVAGLAYGNYWSTTVGPGVIDLTGHLTRADARYTNEHLPIAAKRYAPGWFADAMVEGQLSDIRYLNGKFTLIFLSFIIAASSN